MTDESNRMPRSSWRLLRALFDTRFSGFMAADMVPAIYRFGLLVAGVATLACMVWAFVLSVVAGLVWLIVLGPILFLALAVTMRILLEFVLAVFRMSAELQITRSRLEDIAAALHEAEHTLGRVDENVDALNRRFVAIHEEFPRLAFWRRSNERRTPD